MFRKKDKKRKKDIFFLKKKTSLSSTKKKTRNKKQEETRRNKKQETTRIQRNLFFSQRKLFLIDFETWRRQWFRLASFQSQVSEHKFRMSDVWLNPDIPPFQQTQCDSTTRHDVPSDFQSQVGAVLAWNTYQTRSCPSGPTHEVNPRQQSHLRELRHDYHHHFCGTMQDSQHQLCSHLVQSLIQFALAVRNPCIDLRSKPTASPSSGSLSSCGRSMHASRSIGAMM